MKIHGRWVSELGGRNNWKGRRTIEKEEEGRIGKEEEDGFLN